MVVGGGIGGLATAIRLQLQGIDVTLLEKNPTLGGKLGFLEEKGYRFDKGPSLLTMPWLIDELFLLAGENPKDHFRYVAEEVSCKYFFHDGTQLIGYTEKEKFDAEATLKLGTPKGTVSNFLNLSRTAFENIGNIFLSGSLHKTHHLAKADIPKALRSLKHSYLFKTLHEHNEMQLRHPKLVQIFDRYATYNGSDPYQAPGMLSMIPHLDLNLGTYYPEGGMVSIPNRLRELAVRIGVELRCNVEVTSISRTKGRVSGVVANGEHFASDIVVSNMDAFYTYRDLLNDGNTANMILKQERSSSAFIFYWGIRKEVPSLGLHNILFSKDYPSEFRSLFYMKQPFDDPTVYINITSKCEPGLQAPKGNENWFVMVNAPAKRVDEPDDHISFYKDAILKKIKGTLGIDITGDIETERTLSPSDIESGTFSHLGSLYGTSSNNKMAAFLRHPNFSRSIEGLYFVGGSVHPGGGIPLCLLGAKIVSDMIGKDHLT